MVKTYKPLLFAILLLQPLSADVFASQGLHIKDMVLVAQNNVSTASFINQDLPIGQDTGAQRALLPEDEATGTDDLFGLQGGYIHPYLSVAEEYSDNLFNVDKDTKENWLTTISPGLWFALPRTKVVPITITPHNTSPGGLRLQLKDIEGFSRYTAYLLGALDFKFYSEDSDLNDTNAKVEGLFQYNLPSGLSLRLVDRYTYGQDRFDAGGSTEDGVRTYNSNIVQGTVDWGFTEKFRSRLDYSNFLLDYTDEKDSFLSRMDNSVSAYAIYTYSPKTDLFIEYRFIDVNYDTADLKDNRNNFVYGGIKWAATEKILLWLKPGYQYKKYSDNAIDEINSNADGFAFEGDLEYKFTVKTALAVKMSYKVEETDSRAALNKQVLAASLSYTQKFTDRWKALCYIGYANSDYDQILPPERDDDRLVFSPAVEYLFKEWLMAKLKYTYDTRSSSNDFYDYNTNRVMLSLNFAL